MPSRKRKSRRKEPVAPDPVPVHDVEPEPAPEPEPVSGPVPPQTEVEMPPAVVYLDARTGRATYVVSDDGHVIVRRPGDEWRDRMQLVWRPSGTCPACQKPRVLLMTMAGEAAMCDLQQERERAQAAGLCVCTYAP